MLGPTHTRFLYRQCRGPTLLWRRRCALRSSLDSVNTECPNERTDPVVQGDDSTAYFSEDHGDFLVKNFDRNICNAEGFHHRGMASSGAKLCMRERVEAIDISANVGRFMDWFAEQQVAASIGCSVQMNKQWLRKK